MSLHPIGGGSGRSIRGRRCIKIRSACSRWAITKAGQTAKQRECVGRKPRAYPPDASLWHVRRQSAVACRSGITCACIRALPVVARPPVRHCSGVGHLGCQCRAGRRAGGRSSPAQLLVGVAGLYGMAVSRSSMARAPPARWPRRTEAARASKAGMPMRGRARSPVGATGRTPRWRWRRADHPSG